MAQGSDRVTEAFRRLLADASEGGQAKVDALVALSQRTVFVSLWTPDSDGFRVITNANGQSALPVFTAADLLTGAAATLGWTDPGGPQIKEVGAREALRHAITHNVDYVVVDITSPHSLEIDRSEVEPLLSPQARRESAGPYAAVGRVSSTMMQAVKASPNRRSSGAIEPPTDAVPPTPPQVNPAGPGAPPPPPGVSVGAAAEAPRAKPIVGALSQEPPDALVEALADLLRQYPEVEWAALANVTRGPRGAIPTVGLRVDTAYRARVNEIVSKLQQVSVDQGAALEVLLLDDPDLIRDARANALLFYPWRR